MLKHNKILIKNVIIKTKTIAGSSKQSSLSFCPVDFELNSLSSLSFCPVDFELISLSSLSFCPIDFEFNSLRLGCGFEISENRRKLI